MRFGAVVKKKFLQQLDPCLRCNESVYHQVGLMSNKFTQYIYFYKLGSNFYDGILWVEGVEELFFHLFQLFQPANK